MFPAPSAVAADVATITATRRFYDALAAALTDDVAQIELALATLAALELDPETLDSFQSTQDDARRAAARCRTTIVVLDARHRQLEEAVNATPDAAHTDFYRESPTVPTGPARADARSGATAPAPASGRPPAQPDGAGVIWTDPHGGAEVRGCIVRRTKSTADVEWASGRVQRGVKFTDPDLQWLTADELAAEDAAAARWPNSVRALDGLVAVVADTDAVTITAGTAEQLATIDPEAWRDPNGKDRYAVFDKEDLPKFNQALAAAGRAASRGKPFRRKIDGSDIGDIELTVIPPDEGQAAVTLTVEPYVDAGDAEDLDEVKESDFGEVPDEIEDDDNDGRPRPLTAREREEIQADIRADYEAYLRAHPKPQPLVVTLTVPMVDRLRERLTAQPA